MTAKLTVLIVDENRTSLALMDMLLRKLPGCATILRTDPGDLLGHLDGLDHDLAVIACGPPLFHGIELARRMKAHPQLRDRPILLSADEPDAAFGVRAREAGAADILARPINPVEFRARILAMAGGHGGFPQGEAHARVAWDVPSQAPDITAREEAFLSMLARVAGWRDREPPQHGRRVGRYCAIMAHHLGLPQDYCRDIRLAAPLHDVGRSGLGESLRLKNGFLSPEERKAMEEHTRIGHAMLSQTRVPVFVMAAEIALTHHERWDGSGYPRHLKGEQIPLAGRIAAVADVFDALTSIRAHRSAWALGNAFNYLHENAGVQFDPSCIAALENGRDEVAAVMNALADRDEDDRPAADALVA